MVHPNLQKYNTKDRLLIYGSLLPNSPDWAYGFLGKLRPYRGKIENAVFVDIFNCVFAHIDELTGDKIDSTLVVSIVGIIKNGQSMIHSESGLIKSGRIEEEEVKRIEVFLKELLELFHHILWVKEVDRAYLEKKYLEKYI